MRGEGYERRGRVSTAGVRVGCLSLLDATGYPDPFALPRAFGAGINTLHAPAAPRCEPCDVDRARRKAEWRHQ